MAKKTKNKKLTALLLLLLGGAAVGATATGLGVGLNNAGSSTQTKIGSAEDFAKDLKVKFKENNFQDKISTLPSDVKLEQLILEHTDISFNLDPIPTFFNRYKVSVKEKAGKKIFANDLTSSLEVILSIEDLLNPGKPIEVTKSLGGFKKFDPSQLDGGVSFSEKGNVDYDQLKYEINKLPIQGQIRVEQLQKHFDIKLTDPDTYLTDVKVFTDPRFPDKITFNYKVNKDVHVGTVVEDKTVKYTGNIQASVATKPDAANPKPISPIFATKPINPLSPNNGSGSTISPINPTNPNNGTTTSSTTPLNDVLLEQLNKINGVGIKQSSVLENLLPSELTKDLLNNHGLDLLENNHKIILPDGISASFDIKPKTADDIEGRVAVKISLTDGTNTISKIVSLNHLTNKLDKLDNTKILADTTKDIDKTKTLPSQLESQVNGANSKVVLTIADGSIASEELDNYNITYSNIVANDAEGKLNFSVKFQLKTDLSISKTFDDIEITGLQTTAGRVLDINDELNKELEKITGIDLTPTSTLKDKLPTDVLVTDLTPTNIQPKEGATPYTTPSDIDIKYTLVSDGTNDVDGKVKVVVTLSKDGIEVSETITIPGLKKKIDNVNATDLAIDLPSSIDKSQTLPSDLLTPEGFGDNSKLELSVGSGLLTQEDLDKYNIVFEKDFVNDVNGDASFTVKLTSKTDPTNTKTFENIEITGLKTFELTSELAVGSVELKAEHKGIKTVEEIKNQLNTTADPDQKVAKFKELFDFTLPTTPTNVEIKSIESLELKTGSGTVADLVYKLSKPDVPAGTKTNPEAIKEIVGDTKTIEVANFADADEQIRKEMERVKSLDFSVSTTTNWATKYPYEFTTSNYNATNIQPKLADGVDYSPKNNVVVTFKPKVNDLVNNFDGSVEVTVEFSKNGQTVSKDLKLPGFKKLTKDDFTLSLVDGTTPSATLPTSLLTGENPDPSKLKIAVASSSTFPATELEKQYDVTYQKVETNDGKGTAKFNVVLTSKTTPTNTTTFEDYELINLQKETDNLSTSDLSLTTNSANPTVTTLGSSLVSTTDATKLDNSKLVLTTNGSALTTDELAKYDIEYTTNWINDITGEVSVNTKLTLKEDPKVTKTIENVVISGLKPYSIDETLTSATVKPDKVNTTAQDFKNILDSASSPEEKLAKFKEYFNIVVPEGFELESVTNLEPKPGSNTAGTVTYTLSKTGIAEGSVENPSQTKKVISEPKTLEITNFVDQSKLSATEIDKISSAIVKGDALKTKLPSDITTADLTDANLKLLDTTGAEYVPSPGYTVKYELASPSNANNFEGTVDVKVTLSRNGVDTVKTITLTGTKNKLDLLNESNVSVSTKSPTTKEATLPSSLLNTGGAVESTKLELDLTAATGFSATDLEKYNVTYTNSWLNDVEGKAGFNVTLTLKDDTTKSKTLNDIEITGLKKYTITESLATGSVTLKPAKKNVTTVAEVKNAIDALTEQEQKVAKFNEYFDVVGMPADLVIDEIVSFTPKSGTSTEATIEYKLANKTVTNGTKADKSATTKVSSEKQTLDIANFGYSTDAVQNELDTITSVVLKSTSNLSEKYPFQVETSDITEANIKARTTSGDHALPEYYSIDFSIVDKSKNDLDGTLKVLVTLTQGGTIKTKELTLEGLKSLGKADLELSLKAGKKPTETLPSSLMTDATTIKTSELATSLASASTFGASNLTNLYTISYTKGTINDQTGKASFGIVLTNKANSKFTKIYDPHELTLQREIDTLLPSDLTITTASGLTQNQTIPSSLIDSSKNVVPNKLALSAGSKLTDTKLGAYTIEYTKAWIDDLTGKAGFNVTLKLTTDNSITKTFDNIEMTGLKGFDINASNLSGVSLKDAKAPTTTFKDFKKKLDAASDNAAKLEIFNEYFNSTIPTGQEVEFVSITEATTANAGTFTYKLKRNNVENGSKTSKAKTTNLVSTEKTIVLNGFADQNKLSKKELDKITTLKINPTSDLASKSPEATNDASFTTDTLNPLETSDTTYTTPEGYTITYTKVSDDEVAGTTTVKLTLTKDDVTVEKSLVVSGFKTRQTLLNEELAKVNALLLNAGTSPTTKVPSKVTNSELTKEALQAKLKDNKDYTPPKDYEISYAFQTPKNIDDKAGSADIKITISKAGMSVDKTLNVTGFKKLSQEATEELAKITSLTIKPDSSLLSKIPSKVLAGDLTTSNLVPKTTGNTTYNPLAGYTITYSLPTPRVDDDTNGTTNVIITLEKDGVTVTKTIKVTNFKTAQKEATEELAKIESLSIKSGSSFTNTLPSNVQTKDLNGTNLQPRTSGSTDYTPLEGYSITYAFPTTKEADDNTGTIKINATLTKGAISLTKTFTVSGFKTLLQDTQSELDKITTLVLKSSSILKGKLPTAVEETELTDTNLQPRTSTPSDYTVPSDFTISYKFGTTSPKNDKAGTTKVIVVITKNSVSKEKEFTVSGFKTLEQFIDDEIAKVNSLNVKSGTTLANKLPSATEASELTTANFEPKTTDSKAYSAPSGYTVSYAFADPKETKDYAGTEKIVMTISKDGVSKTKEIVATGYKNKLDSVTTTNFTLNTEPADLKNTILASELIDSEGVKTSKLKPSITGMADFDFSKYKVTYEKSWLNDVNGNAGFNVTLKLIENEKINKTLENIQLTELKPYKITEELSNIRLKADKTSTTIADVSRQISTQSNNEGKINKFKEYFDFEIPEGMTIETLTSLDVKSGSTTTGTVTYTLSKAGVANGSQTEKNKTQKVVSTSKTTDIGNFADQNELSKKELDKITTLKIKSTSDLAYKSPEATTNKNFTTSTLDALTTDSKTYALPDGYTLTYSKVSDNEAEGKAIVKVTLFKDGVTVQKQLEVSGFKTTNALLTEELAKVTTISINTGTSPTKNVPSKVSDSDLTKDNLQAKKADGKNYTAPTGYTISYVFPTDRNANDEAGTANVKILISKSGTSVDKTLNVTGFKQLNQEATEELAKIASLTIKSGAAIANKLPSTLKVSELTTDNLEPKKSDGSNYELLPGYAIKYTFPRDKVASDIAGTIKVTATLTKDSISLSQEFTVSGFKTLDQDIQSEINKIGGLALKGETLKAKLPSTVTSEELVGANLQLQDTSSNNHTVSEGFTISYKFATTNPQNDVDGTTKIIVIVSKGGVSKEKEFTVSGFKTQDQFITEEISKVNSLSVKSGTVLAGKLPSTALPAELTITNLEPKTSTPTAYSVPKGYTISYAFATDKEAKDYAGTAKVVMTISKDGVSKTKTFTTTGFKNKLDLVNTSNFKLTTNPESAKTTTLASSLINAKGAVEATKLKPSITGMGDFEFGKYNITYEKVWINDVEGKAGFNVVLKLAENELITKTLNNIEITGLKNYQITEQLSNIRLKESKKSTTITEVSQQIAAASNDATRIAKFQEYFDFDKPAGTEIEALASVNTKGSSKTTGTVTYTLSKAGVASGSQTEKDKTQKVVSASKTTDIANFADQNDLSNKELAKITKLQIKSGSGLESMSPETIADSNLTTSTLNPLGAGDATYVTPKGYTLSYSKVSGDETAGTTTIKVKLVKDGVTVEKDLIVSGFKTRKQLLDEELAKVASVVINTGTAPTTKVPSKVPGSDLTKANLQAKKADNANYTPPTGYEISYAFPTDKKANDVAGTADVTVSISKSGTSVNKTINVSGFKTTQKEATEELAKITSLVVKTASALALKVPSKALPTELTNDNLQSKVAGDAAYTPLEGYTLSYSFPTPKVQNDSAGTANVIVTLIKGSIIVKKTLSASGFQTQRQEAQNELAKITGLIIKPGSIIANKLPSALQVGDLTTSNLQARNESADYALLDGYSIVYSFPADKATNDVAGSIKITATLKKGDVSLPKDFTVSGFKTQDQFITEELAKVGSLNVKSGSVLAGKLPSTTTVAELNSTNLEPKNAASTLYSAPSGYTVSYTFPTTKKPKII